MVTITIDTGNAAFGDNDEMKAVEVARILRHLAETIEARATLNHPLRDVNGNKVGESSER